MKTRNILTGGFLAAAGAALFAPSARAVTYATGDLLLGFELPGNSNDYVVDLGAASTFINATSPFNATLNLGNIASDLSNTFGSSWATNNVTQGTNLQWGVIGATSNILGGTTGSGGTFGLPKNTIFLTIAETTPGSGSAAPTEYSQTGQGAFNSKVGAFSGAFSTSSPTTNSNFATVESASAASSWSLENPSANGFTTGNDIEQADSGGFFGPTNSQLDLYELLPTNASGTGLGKELGNFTLSSSANLTYTPTPEPASLGLLVFGTGFLGLARFRRKSAQV